MVTLSVLFKPLLSVTVSSNVYVPASVGKNSGLKDNGSSNTTLGPATCLQLNDIGSPFGSMLLLASRVTVCSVLIVRSEPALAIGATFCISIVKVLETLLFCGFGSGVTSPAIPVLASKSIDSLDTDIAASSFPSSLVSILLTAISTGSALSTRTAVIVVIVNPSSKSPVKLSNP